MPFDFGDPFKGEIIRRWKEGEDRNSGPSHPYAFSEGVFPETDDRYEVLPLDPLKDKGIADKLYYRKRFICKQRNPHFHWVVFADVSGAEVPTELQGTFTCKERMFAAIEDYLKK